MWPWPTSVRCSCHACTATGRASTASALRNAILRDTRTVTTKSIGRQYYSVYDAVNILLELRRIDPDDDLPVLWAIGADKGISVGDITDTRDETEIVDLL